MAPLPGLVSLDELELSRDRVLEETTSGLPDSVRDAIDILRAVHGGAVFVAAVQDGAVVVLPFSGRGLVQQQPVTFVGFGEFGAGAMITPLFDGVEGATPAFSMNGGIGGELGIYNFAIAFGFDAAVTPGHTVTYGHEGRNENLALSVFPQPWGGLGAYLLRPLGRGASLLVLAQGGWNGPAHVGVGGRLVLGLPIDRSENWLRFALVGSTFPNALWDEGGTTTPLHVVSLRMGLGSRF